MFAGFPALFMAIMTIWAVAMNQAKFLGAHNMLLTVINICILILAVWIVIEGLIKFFSSYGTTPGEPEPATT
jgi:carbon starvation protein